MSVLHHKINTYISTVQYYYCMMTTHPSLKESSFLCSIVITCYRILFPEANSISCCQREYMSNIFSGMAFPLFACLN